MGRVVPGPAIPEVLVVGGYLRMPQVPVMLKMPPKMVAQVVMLTLAGAAQVGLIVMPGVELEIMAALGNILPVALKRELIIGPEKERMEPEGC